MPDIGNFVSGDVGNFESGDTGILCFLLLQLNQVIFAATGNLAQFIQFIIDTGSNKVSFINSNRGIFIDLAISAGELSLTWQFSLEIVIILAISSV